MKRASLLIVLAAALGCGRVLGSDDGGGGAGTTGGAGITGAAGTTGAAGQGGTTGTAGATGATCIYGGTMHPAGMTFPSTDGCNSCTCSSSGQVACTQRACPPDGGTAACAFDAVYRYGMVGGFVAYVDEVTLSPPSSYARARTGVRGTGADISCAPALPACNTVNTVDVADVMHDLADTDVQKALAMATPPLFGTDPRPVDGSVFSLTRADGRGFLAGGACSAGAGTACAGIPTGIAKLVADLRALDEQALKDPSCASLR